MRFTLSQGIDPRSTMVVETIDTPGGDLANAPTGSLEARVAAVVEDMRAFMGGSNCPLGLIFTEEECIVLRDTYGSMDPAESIQEDSRIPTPALLEVLGRRNSGTLATRVELWLEVLTRAWQDAVPVRSTEAQILLYDVVSAAADATIHPWGHAA